MLGVDEKGHGRTLIGHSLMADADLGSKLAIAPLKGQMNWHTWKDSIEYFLIEKACGNTVRLSPPRSSGRHQGRTSVSGTLAVEKESGAR